VQVTNGTLRGVEVGQIANSAGASRIVDSAAGTGTIPFKSLSASLKLADGAIEGNDISVSGDGFMMNIDGRISLMNDSLRARGVLVAARTDSDRGETRDVPFVVSGSWADPYVLPDYERLIQRSRAEPNSRAPIGAIAQPDRPNG